MKNTIITLLMAFSLTGCAVYELAAYWLFPDYPVFQAGQNVNLTGLKAPVQISVSAAGVARVVADSDVDAMFATGYLQARDRMFQMDIFRRLAKGELSALVGVRPFGAKSSLDVDKLNRFMGFAAAGQALYANTSTAERAAIDAFAAGVNAWIAEGPLPPEHRLLGATSIAPWSAADSLAIYQMLMFGLSGNQDREIRRLLIACEAGVDAVERLWPSDIDFGEYALPLEFLSRATWQRPAAIVPEVRTALPDLCPKSVAENGGTTGRGARSWQSAAVIELAEAMIALGGTWSASNNWVLSGALTKSGAPLLANDPHLPHMNPPIAWAIEQQTPDYRVAGFTLVGLHRVVFGWNDYVAWGATTNHVDRQDLVLERPESTTFVSKVESFEIAGQEPQSATGRYTSNGLILNDMEPELGPRLPLLALRTTGVGAATDIDAARQLSYAKSASDVVTALRLMESGCTSWVYADRQGQIGYESPCLLPVRVGWSGAFPVAGWVTDYTWQGFVNKAALPAAQNPARGWLVTANNQIAPAERFSTTYNGDAQGPFRYRRIAELIERDRQRPQKISPDDSAAYQLDIHDRSWQLAAPVLQEYVCNDAGASGAAQALCAWNGEAGTDSLGATLYVFTTNALIDLALADELHGGAEGWSWRFIQSLPQFEVNVQWTWQRPASDVVWDDVRTPAVESKADIVRAALALAEQRLSKAHGQDTNAWRWGDIRAFSVRHIFAQKGGPLGYLLNGPSVPGFGTPETVNKSQFARSDREHFYGVIGAPLRYSVDLAEPWATKATLAGGQSGWPRSPHYASEFAAWQQGQGKPLSPSQDSQAINVVLTPKPN